MSTIRSAVISTWGAAPRYISVPTPSIPCPSSSLIQLKVLATGLHQVVKSRAANKHYSSTTLPHVPGIDGVGLTSSDQRVYFNTMSSGGGSFSEFVNVPLNSTTPLPPDLDPVKAAALLNPAMSSWMALKTRTANLPANFTCLILGATSTSGQAAISIARAFGAGKVIGVARNAAVLSELELDQEIVLQHPVTATDFSSLGDVDVVLDYIYGPAMVYLLSSLSSDVQTQYVHIGGVSSPTIELPGAVLRSKDITIRGAGPGAWSLGALVGELPAILEALKGVRMRDGSVRVVRMEDVESEWEAKGPERLVFVP